MNYQVIGPPRKCDWMIGGDNCHREAEVMFVIPVGFREKPIFRFYCPEHALAQQEIEARA